MPAARKAPKLWATRAFHLHEDGVVGQTLGATPDQLAGEHRTDRAVDVAHLLHELNLLAALDRVDAFGDQLLVERALQAVVLLVDPGGAARRPALPVGGTCD